MDLRITSELKGRDYDYLCTQCTQLCMTGDSSTFPEKIEMRKLKIKKKIK